MLNFSIEMLQMGLLQGLILAFVALGISIPFRLLNFPDITVEGSYPFGGVLTTVLMINVAFHPVMFLFGAIGAGFLGVITAFIYLRYRINTLLAGIIVSTMVYTLNLRLMKKPTLDIFHYDALIIESLTIKILIIGIVAAIVASSLIAFLYSQVGLRLRAVGLNSLVAERQGVNLNYYTYLALFIGNFLCGLAGGIMVYTQKYVDISMGVGMIINALAAMMLGEAILGAKGIKRNILAPIVGAILYQQIQGLALSFGLAPTDLKLFTAALVLFIIALNKQKV